MTAERHQGAAAAGVPVTSTAARSAAGASELVSTMNPLACSGAVGLFAEDDYPLYGPVEPRTTSSGRNMYSECGAGWPATSSTRARTAATDMACTGCRSVVSGGSVNAIRGESS